MVCPQKLDERNKRVKTDGVDAKALCLKLDRFVEGNRIASAGTRATQAEEQKRAIHRQREQLVKARKRLEAQGRSLIVNHGIEPVNKWWKRRTFAALQVPAWMKELLSKHSTHPPCAGGKDPCLNRATARGRHLQATAWTGALEQCRD